MTLTVETMDKVSDWLKNASPEQMHKLAEDIAEKAPYLVPVQATPKEKADGFIKINIDIYDPQADTAYHLGYLHGLIDNAHLIGLLSDEEVKEYHQQIASKGND